MPTLAEYAAVGWQCCLIEPGAKGPCYAKWNVEPLQPNHVVPFGYGVGLLHTLSGTAALDIDDYAAAKVWLAERNVDLQALLDDPAAVQIVSGRPGSNKLLYALPAWLAMPSKKVVVGGRTILEFRAATADGKSVQDILPHPGYLSCRIRATCTSRPTPSTSGSATGAICLPSLTPCWRSGNSCCWPTRSAGCPTWGPRRRRTGTRRWPRSRR